MTMTDAVVTNPGNARAHNRQLGEMAGELFPPGSTLMAAGVRPVAGAIIQARIDPHGPAGALFLHRPLENEGSAG